MGGGGIAECAELGQLRKVWCKKRKRRDPFKDRQNLRRKFLSQSLSFLVAHVCVVLSCNVMGKAEISVESFVLLCANEKCLPCRSVFLVRGWSDGWRRGRGGGAKTCEREGMQFGF